MIVMVIGTGDVRAFAIRRGTQEVDHMLEGDHGVGWPDTTSTPEWDKRRGMNGGGGGEGGG